MGNLHRTTAKFCLTALLLAAASTSARAQLRLNCPIPWDQLRTLETGSLDADLWGIKVRDWKVEYLDEALRKSEECVRTGPGGPGGKSLRDAEHRDAVARVYPFAKDRYLPELDQRLRIEGVPAMVATAISQANLTQVKLTPNGMPSSILLKYDDPNIVQSRQSREYSCGSLDRGIDDATAESYRQAAVFARLCAAAQQTTATTVATLERKAAGLDAVTKAAATLATQVDAASGRPLAVGDCIELTHRDHAILTHC
ncbi:hypothetical protein [Roseateles albus]|uniref:Secreted protein n=1 Tax=Roseateles albus TaxID=2987525 RepID=A0ABT5KN82_9BURK|nr:hypothetical protein [Roseateles albus]MDC8774375.1 hypothetical protein [Roseateles albus]